SKLLFSRRSSSRIFRRFGCCSSFFDPLLQRGDLGLLLFRRRSSARTFRRCGCCSSFFDSLLQGGDLGLISLQFSFQFRFLSLQLHDLSSSLRGLVLCLVTSEQ